MPNKKAIKSTLELFNLDRIDRDVFQWKGQNFGWQRIYGGQVMAQCLIAANHTVEAPHQAHSFHSYFFRPGIMEESILFDVDRIRNGNCFTTRRERETEIESMPTISFAGKLPIDDQSSKAFFASFLSRNV